LTIVAKILDNHNDEKTKNNSKKGNKAYLGLALAIFASITK